MRLLMSRHAARHLPGPSLNATSQAYCIRRGAGKYKTATARYCTATLYAKPKQSSGKSQRKMLAMLPYLFICSQDAPWDAPASCDTTNSVQGKWWAVAPHHRSMPTTDLRVGGMGLILPSHYVYHYHRTHTSPPLHLVM